jgi:hypothetical protein
MLRSAFFATFTLLAGTSEIDRMVADLGNDDVEIRNRAVSELLRKGREARPALEAARSSPDLEVRERARFILSRTSPLQILLAFDPVRADANEPLNMSVRMINESDQEAVFFPAGLSSRIVLLQLFGEPREGTVVFGGRSIRRAGCQLSEDDFIRVAAGSGFCRELLPIRGREIDVSTEFRNQFPDICFWAADTAGLYRVVASYRYDRVAYKSRCNLACPDHDDPRKLWNRCFSQPLENDRSFTIAIGVERCGCDRH